jgi:hypothetical protein
MYGSIASMAVLLILVVAALSTYIFIVRTSLQISSGALKTNT